MDIIIAILTIFALAMIFGLAGKGAGAAFGLLSSAPSSMRKISLRRMKSDGGHAFVKYAYYDDEKKIGVAHVICPVLKEEKSVFSGNIPCLEMEAERQMNAFDTECGGTDI